MAKSKIEFFRVISLHNVSATGLPSRLLHLSFSFTHPFQENILIVDSWASVTTINGAKLTEGSLLRIHSRELQPKEEGYGELAIPMTSQALGYIEERRAGGDIELRVNSSILALHYLSNDQSKSFEAVYGQLDQGKTGGFTYKIHQSEWVRLLGSFQWSELELLEIPSRNLRTLPIPERALRRFEDAVQQYRRGYWESAMANCRMAYEALVKEVSEEDDMRMSPEVLAELLGEPKRAEAIDKAIFELKDFLHLARHEQQPTIEVGPADATFAIRVTGAILTYIGEFQQSA